jgi:hypothetical protein
MLLEKAINQQQSKALPEIANNSHGGSVPPKEVVTNVKKSEVAPAHEKVGIRTDDYLFLGTLLLEWR